MKYDSNGFFVTAIDTKEVANNRIRAIFKIVCKIARKDGSKFNAPYNERSGLFIKYRNSVKNVTFSRPDASTPFFRNKNESDFSY
ncbi:hypothetical protein Ciccas_010214 [Cichlidogyrus casuarinus]|uniref:Uncharacterized protein n=1 Tax=Cichlidogyrus casuarinus TaxID=1844966 RepID=A0ABD2PUQ7_9PLAT